MTAATRLSAARAERAEAETMYALGVATPPRAYEALGMAAARIAGGVVLALRHDVTEFWNKALGFGIDAPVTAQVLDEVVAFCRDHGAPRTTVQIAPELLPNDWAQLADAHGLTPDSSVVRLSGEVDDVIARTERLVTDTPPQVGTVPVGPADAEQWGELFARGFEMPTEHYGAMAAGTVNPDFAPYAARWDGDLVGAATVRVAGEVAHLAGCAVLPEARCRGGHTALLLARARAARDRDCRWLTVETGSEAPGTHNTSLHNLLRAGLAVQYERVNWTWTNPDSASAS